MQTFLPYPDFRDCAKVLDMRRLGKQRVEAMQILHALHSTRYQGWHSMPIVRAWRGYEAALALYMNCMIDEWVARGYRNTMQRENVSHSILPPWLGREDFHASMRSNLLRKKPEYYQQFGWTEPDTLPYLWSEIARDSTKIVR